MRSTATLIRWTTLALLGALATPGACRAGAVPANGFQNDARGFGVGDPDGAWGRVSLPIAGAPAGARSRFLGEHGDASVAPSLTAGETYSVEFDPSVGADRDGNDAPYDGPDVFKSTATNSIATVTFQRVKRQDATDEGWTLGDLVIASVNAAGGPAVAPEPASIASMLIATTVAGAFAARRRRRR